MASFANDPYQLGAWPENHLPGLYLFATLPVIANLRTGVTAYTSDQKLCAWNGSAWLPVNTGSPFASSVSATLASGAQDLGTTPPTGYGAGVTNRLLLTANIAGSTINGLLIAPDGWSVLLVNTGTVAASLTFPHQGAASSLNQFNGSGGSTMILPAFAGVLISSVAGMGWVFT